VPLGADDISCRWALTALVSVYGLEIAAPLSLYRLYAYNLFKISTIVSRDSGRSTESGSTNQKSVAAVTPPRQKEVLPDKPAPAPTPGKRAHGSTLVFVLPEHLAVRFDRLA